MKTGPAHLAAALLLAGLFAALLAWVYLQGSRALWLMAAVVLAGALVSPTLVAIVQKRGRLGLNYLRLLIGVAGLGAAVMLADHVVFTAHRLLDPWTLAYALWPAISTALSISWALVGAMSVRILAEPGWHYWFEEVGGAATPSRMAEPTPENE